MEEKSHLIPSQEGKYSIVMAHRKLGDYELSSERRKDDGLLRVLGEFYSGKVCFRVISYYL